MNVEECAVDGSEYDSVLIGGSDCTARLAPSAQRYSGFRTYIAVTDGQEPVALYSPELGLRQT